MTALVADFSSNRSVGSERFLPGFLWAVLIHLLLILLFMPTLEPAAPAAPTRITVQVSQLEPIVEEVVEPEPIPEPVAPIKKPETNKKLLVAKDDTPPEPEEMVVIEQPPESEPVEEIKPEPPKPEPKKVEPKPEPKKAEKPKPKPEPKKVEKPKPKPEPKIIEKPQPKPEKPIQTVKQEQQKPTAEPEIVEKIEQVETPSEVVQGEVTDTPAAPSATASGSSTSSQADATGTGNAANGNGNGSNPGGTGEVDRNTAWKGYGQLLYAMVSKNKTYPQLAIRRHLEGTVMVSVRFEQGRMVSMSVVGQGSGHSVLDRAAHEMVEKAVKALPVRGDLSRKSFSVVVPVNFRLTD